MECGTDRSSSNNVLVAKERRTAWAGLGGILAGATDVQLSLAAPYLRWYAGEVQRPWENGPGPVQ